MLVRPDSLIVAVSADLLGESDISPRPIWRTSLRAQPIRKGFQTPLVRADNRANGRSLIACVRSLSMACRTQIVCCRGPRLGTHRVCPRFREAPRCRTKIACVRGPGKNRVCPRSRNKVRSVETNRDTICGDYSLTHRANAEPNPATVGCAMQCKKSLTPTPSHGVSTGSGLSMLGGAPPSRVSCQGSPHV